VWGEIDGCLFVLFLVVLLVGGGGGWGGGGGCGGKCEQVHVEMP